MSGTVTWSRFVWRHLDQAAAAELWAELADWVQWLRERYNLGSAIPQCWYRHPAAVEELTALMSAHTAAYQQLATPKGAPIRDHDLMSGWHRDALAPALSRIKGQFGECSTEGCGYYAVKAPVDDGLNEWIAADVADRLEPSATAADDLSDLDECDDESMSTEDVAELISSGDATVDDPEDDYTGFVYREQHWSYNPDTDAYSPDPPD